MSSATENGASERASRRERRREKRREQRKAERHSRPGDEQDDRHRPSHEWKIQFGRITLYNTRIANRRLIKPPIIEDAPMTVQVVHDAFVSRRAVRADADGDGSRHVSGAIYDAQGVILPDIAREAQERRGIVPRQNPNTVDPARMAGAERISGRCAYLGTLQNHFGHFLLETMARAWYLVNLDPSVRVVFHSHRVEDAGRVKGYVQATLNALSIAPERVVMAHRDISVEELIIPTPLFWLRWKAGSGYCIAFDHIREHLVRRGASARDLPRRLYLTRQKFASVIEQKLEKQGIRARKKAGLHLRMALNEDEAEALFAERGFHVVAPETLPFEEQIMLIGHASHIAGLSGSALHMALFNGKPDTKVIELSIRSAAILNQLIVNGVRGLESHHIFCANDYNDERRPLLDMSVVRRAMDEIQ